MGIIASKVTDAELTGWKSITCLVHLIDIYHSMKITLKALYLYWAWVKKPIYIQEGEEILTGSTTGNFKCKIKLNCLFRVKCKWLGLYEWAQMDLLQCRYGASFMKTQQTYSIKHRRALIQMAFFSRASDPVFNQVAKTKEKTNTSSPFRTYSRPSVPPHCSQRWYWLFCRGPEYECITVIIINTVAERYDILDWTRYEQHRVILSLCRSCDLAKKLYCEAIYLGENLNISTISISQIIQLI